MVAFLLSIGAKRALCASEGDAITFTLTACSFILRH